MENESVIKDYGKEVLLNMNKMFMEKIKNASSSSGAANESSKSNGFLSSNSIFGGFSQSSSSSSSNSTVSLKNTCIDYLIHDQIQRKRFRSVLTDKDVIVDDRLNKKQKGAASAGGGAMVRLYSFGSGDCGQLGHGVDNGSTDTEVKYPRLIESLKDQNALAISCGGMHNLFINSKGEVLSWGCADNGVLGRDGDENYPALVQFPSNLGRIPIYQVSCGDCHSAALSIYGNVFNWGTFKDQDGKNWINIPGKHESLGQVAEVPFIVPKFEELASKPIMISSGANHMVALLSDGKVLSWGIGEHCELGRKVDAIKDDKKVYKKEIVVSQHLSPDYMIYKNGKQVTGVRYVACGSYHTFIIQSSDSSVYGCGLNQYGQVGIETSKENNEIPYFVKIETLGKIQSRIAEVAGGEHFSIARTYDGKVYSWGRCDQSQLGYPIPKSESEVGGHNYVAHEVPFPNKEHIIQISCGSSHVACVSHSGKLYTWGFGVMLQLGNGKEDDEATPYLVSKLMDKDYEYAHNVSAGGQHTIVMLAQKL